MPARDTSGLRWGEPGLSKLPGMPVQRTSVDFSNPATVEDYVDQTNNPRIKQVWSEVMAGQGPYADIHNVLPDIRLTDNQMTEFHKQMEDRKRAGKAAELDAKAGAMDFPGRMQDAMQTLPGFNKTPTEPEVKISPQGDPLSFATPYEEEDWFRKKSIQDSLVDGQMMV